MCVGVCQHHTHTPGVSNTEERSILSNETLDCKIQQQLYIKTYIYRELIMYRDTKYN